MMSILRALPCLAFAFTTGCFVYVPVGTEPPAGSTVRAYLTEAGSKAVTPALGPDVQALSGIAAASAGGELPIAVHSYRIRDFGERPFGQGLVRLQDSHIAQLQLKQFSRTRTALFIGAVIAGGFLLDRGLNGGFFGADEKPGPRDPS